MSRRAAEKQVATKSDGVSLLFSSVTLLLCVSRFADFDPERNSGT